jgi:hypothetical protein
MPLIEKQFRGIGRAGRAHGRRIDRWMGSVRRPGDVSRRLQRRVGAVSDPIDFRSYRSVNIYDEKNAYYYEDNPWKRTPKPGYRDYRDHLYSTFEDRNLVELALGTHGGRAGSTTLGVGVRSGRRRRLLQAALRQGDRRHRSGGRDVLARPLRPALHPGARLATLGRKLRGKIHITSGTMDNGYLNNAVYQMEEFLMQRDAVGRGRDHLRRAPRALLHGRYRACRTPSAAARSTSATCRRWRRG